MEAAIKLLEDNPLFNAGRGAVFAADGTNQLDAAIMDGATMRAGAVADVQRTRHPISLARAVMEQSPHVMLVGAGADAFAASVHLEQVAPSFFFTERRWQQLVDQLTREGAPIPPRPGSAPAPPAKPVAFFETPDTHKFGTVGVVALDRNGNVAAGTSTGGTTAKRWNRVGDSPIIGAGTYASNQSCAVSGTGVGEYFIRLTVARTICALVQYKGMTLQAAVDEVVQKQLVAMHGDGGVIAVAPDGQMAWSFNTPGMFRARLAEGGTVFPVVGNAGVAEEEVDQFGVACFGANVVGQNKGAALAGLDADEGVGGLAVVAAFVEAVALGSVENGDAQTRSQIFALLGRGQVGCEHGKQRRGADMERGL